MLQPHETSKKQKIKRMTAYLAANLNDSIYGKIRTLVIKCCLTLKEPFPSHLCTL